MLSGFKPQEIEELEGARQAIVAVLNLVEELKQENQELRAENQRLRDEINRLKGEQGKPEIKADKSKAKDVSSEEERRTPKSWSKGRKLNKIVVHWEEKLSVDKSELPADAQFKGYEDAVVQDIRLEANNIRFVKEKYYSPSQQRTYLAPLPAGYVGEFGPGVRALVLTLYYASNMTEAKIAEFLGHIGVFISAGQISNVLIKNQDAWHGEKAAVWRAGLASSSWQHIDDTSTRVNGENQHCHVVCNPLYSAYFTRPAKDRLTVIGLLQEGDSLNFLLTAQTPAWLDIFKTPLWVQRLIRTWPQNELLTHAQMDALLARDAGSLNDQQQARILEAAALTAYHKQNHLPIVTTLISDDAAQFQHVTQRQALCWIHEGRHYKKLTPFVDHHRQLLEDFQTQFWDFYHELQGYQENPSPAEADRLRVEFGTLFRTTTGYQGLDQRIAKTLAKQDRLLEVLDQPQLPLHNNPAELAARQRVRKRDISFGPRTSDGVAAWDTFMTLSETAKKLGVNFYAYLHDRVSETYRMPTLATLIQQRSLSEQPQPASA
jgi:regulator of replication initiation timing